jgi:hypothetical protein
MFKKLFIICALLLSAIPAYAQDPQLITLPADATGAVPVLGKGTMTYNVISIAGWLLCNGARVKKSDYPALWKKLSAPGTTYDVKADAESFLLPPMPFQYKEGKLFKGWAINPFDTLDPRASNSPPGVLQQFEFSDSL